MSIPICYDLCRNDVDIRSDADVDVEMGMLRCVSELFRYRYRP